MKIHESAVSFLNDLKKQDTTGQKVLRIRKNGCSWHAKWEFVLDEQKANDLVYCDKGFRILVDKSLSHRVSCATIEYVKTIRGYQIRLR